MKKVLSIAVLGALVWACNNTTNTADVKTEEATDGSTQSVSYNYYGDSITPDNAVSASELLAMMEGQDSVMVKVEGTITGSCAKKGCWMKMDMGNEEKMHISFKDYGFFVPRNMDGETAIIEGYASVDTMDVAYLQHLAMDAGKSEEEIAQITEPKYSLTYVATGVLVEQGTGTKKEESPEATTEETAE